MKQNDLVTNKVFETYKGELQNFKDNLFNRLDNIVGQLETMRDEQTLAYHQHKELE